MDEYLDVLDENGNKTGKKKLRSEVHRDGDWHLATHVWIVNSKGELLIQKRSANKDSSPGLWDISSVCHVVAGEDATQAAIRETQEELGISLSGNELKQMLSYKRGKSHDNGQFVNNGFFEVFLVEKDIEVQDINFQQDEISEVKYIPFQELEERIKDDDRQYVDHPEEYKKLFEVLHKKFDM
jgi:isopentenyldiphosphate isomerase